MAQEMVTGYHAKRPAATNESLAVLTFDCNERLAKQRVGSAIAELLTQKIISLNAFRVVERTQLDQALREQSLGLTGAIDSASAASVGRLVGAKLMILGSIDKLGATYRVNSRLIDVETSDVISTSFTETDASQFEEEARPYLNLVPETQTIGIYGTAGAASLGFTLPTGADALLTSGTFKGMAYDATSGVTLEQQRLTAGFGVRYVPVPWLLLDGLFLPFSTSVLFGGNVTTRFDGVAYRSGVAGKISGSAGALCASYQRRLAAPLMGFIGAGIHFLRMQWDSPGFVSDMYSQSGADELEVAFGPLTPRSGGGGGGSVSITRPFVRLGLEWRPQPRIGFGLFGDAYPVQASTGYYSRLTISGNRTVAVGVVDARLFSVTYARAELHLTGSFYF